MQVARNWPCWGSRMPAPIMISNRWQGNRDGTSSPMIMLIYLYFIGRHKFACISQGCPGNCIYMALYVREPRPIEMSVKGHA